MPCHHMTNVFLLILREVFVQSASLSQTQILNSLSRDEDLDASSLINSEVPSKTCMKHVKIRHIKNLPMPTPFSVFLVYFPLSVLINFLFTCHVHFLCAHSISLYINNLLPIYICFSPSHSDFISPYAWCYFIT